MDDTEDDFDEVIDEVINEVCGEEEKSKIKKTYPKNTFNNLTCWMFQMLHE